jgi:hypothetical protein
MIKPDARCVQLSMELIHSAAGCRREVRRFDLNITYIWLSERSNGCRNDENGREIANGMNMMEIDPDVRKD